VGGIRDALEVEYSVEKREQVFNKWQCNFWSRVGIWILYGVAGGKAMDDVVLVSHVVLVFVESSRDVI
jgi:hypothetical protein